jgi:hypothetical protein
VRSEELRSTPEDGSRADGTSATQKFGFQFRLLAKQRNDFSNCIHRFTFLFPDRYF